MATQTCDDQNSDMDGWEIANGHHHSTQIACNLDQRCPDVVLKAQSVVDTTEKFLRCPVCLNGYKFLKNLGCRCNACMNCAERMLTQWREGSEGDEENTCKKTRLCTTCDQEHTVPILFHKILKPVFSNGALKCMTCQGRKDTQDGWWCQDCSMILCSKCAHKGHRDHVTVEFDQDYEAVRYCLSMLQMESQETATRFKTMVWAKFEQIFKIIEQAIDQEMESQNKTRRARLTEVFGHCTANQTTDTGYERLHRRLSIIQQKAKQQFPNVLDEILSLSGLGTKEAVGLKTDILAEKIVELLTLTVSQLSPDDFKLTPEQPPVGKTDVDANETGANGTIMYIGEPVQPSGDPTDSTNRHY